MSSLYHYGTPRHSGRYPFGSGGEPQRSITFLQSVDQLKKKGMTEKEIAKGFGMTPAQLKSQMSVSKAERRAYDRNLAIKYKDKGMSNTAIGDRMGINESSVRSLLDPVLHERSQVILNTKNLIKERVDKGDYVDVGVGVEHHLGINRTKLKTAVQALENEGYKVENIYVDQVGNPGKKTTVQVLTKKDKTISDVYDNMDNIKNIQAYTTDNGKTWLDIEPPTSVSSKRIDIRYGEDGGKDKDGLIEIRRGADDLSLGKARYAQVRIAVDDTHFIKGMAMYSDDLPDGVDIVFNTNKSPTGNKLDALKPMKTTKNNDLDPDNPFGAVVKQRRYIDKDGKEHLSALNIVNEEGDWDKWSKNLSSQMLSKQKTSVAKKQLDLALKAKQDEYDEIMALTNPAVKKKLLDSFAEDTDAASYHLKAAGMPRQSTKVILPFPDMKENEVYCPSYRDGERLALVRYPHGGTFEIPEVTVNNRFPKAKKLLQNAKDAMGLHPSVAEQLSGADYDGDYVIAIPNNNNTIRSTKPLDGLKDFDPKERYKLPDDAPKMSAKSKAKQMGDVSNLITDMTIKGANTDEIARAVRHSMVVIDAEKHHLDYKQSAIDNNISKLKEDYQGGSRKGASTLISKASSDTRVGTRKEYIDPATGKKKYNYFEEDGYVDSNGRFVRRTTKSKKMLEVDDAYALSSGTPIENIYADHANQLKALANSARKTSIETPDLKYSASAKKTYTKEVETLNAKLNVAEWNKPLERQAQMLANTIVKQKKQDNPDMEGSELKKIKGHALTKARARVGANKELVDITPKEWDAIQSGAISNNKLKKILNNTDIDKVRQYSMPKESKGLSAARVNKAQNMINAGLTQAEVADALGVSVSTINKELQ